MVNGESWSTRTVQSHPRCGALRSDCAALYKTDKALGFDTARCAVALKIKLGSRVGSPTVEAPAMGGGSWIGLMGLETFCEFDVRENLYAPPGCLGRQNGEDEYSSPQPSSFCQRPPPSHWLSPPIKTTPPSLPPLALVLLSCVALTRVTRQSTPASVALCFECGNRGRLMMRLSLTRLRQQRLPVLPNPQLRRM